MKAEAASRRSFLALLAAVSCVTPVHAMQGRALIHLDCGAAPPDLCEALYRSIVRVTPVAAVSRVPRPSSPPADLLIWYRHGRLSDRSVAGRLDWHHRSGPFEQGAEIGLDVMDRALSPADLQRFTDTLIEADSNLRRTLSEMFVY